MRAQQSLHVQDARKYEPAKNRVSTEHVCTVTVVVMHAAELARTPARSAPQQPHATLDRIPAAEGFFLRRGVAKLHCAYCVFCGSCCRRYVARYSVGLGGRSFTSALSPCSSTGTTVESR